mgnify:CR=1 FL=1
MDMLVSFSVINSRYSIMLARFTISNFKTFRDEVVLSMEPSREQQHRSIHVHEGVSPTLRFALIYGPNSSGKSNLFKGVEYLRSLVVNGRSARQPLNCPKFGLDDDSKSKSSCFEIIFETSAVRYIYSVHVDPSKISFEELRTKPKTGRERLMFRRKASKNGLPKFSFGSFVSKLPSEERKILKFVSKGTRDNQLFLHETIERNIDLFQEAYDWFSESIRVFTPKSVSHGIEFRIGKDTQFTEFLEKNMKDFDPSIVNIDTKIVPASNHPDIPERLLSDMDEKIDEETAVYFINPQTGKRLVITRNEDGELSATSVYARHQSTVDPKASVPFELDEESDGTRRFLEIAPLIYELMHSEDTVVALIDEVDRSFHSGMTDLLMSRFLKSSSSRNCQIIATTHDTALLQNEALKRRDILWVLDRADGCSNLGSFRKSSIRSDNSFSNHVLRSSTTA